MISNIHILSNSQIALTWVLKHHPFNVFAFNRLKNFRVHLKTLIDQRNKVQFSFTRAHKNMTYLVTREISLRIIRIILLGGRQVLVGLLSPIPLGHQGI